MAVPPKRSRHIANRASSINGAGSILVNKPIRLSRKMASRLTQNGMVPRPQNYLAKDCIEMSAIRKDVEKFLTWVCFNSKDGVQINLARLSIFYQGLTATIEWMIK